MSPDDVAELFAPFGPVTVRRMFGGLGIYANGRMFALVAASEVFMKADAESRPAFEAAGSVPFVYEGGGRRVALPYMRLPAEAYDDEAALVRYARLADDATRRSPPKGRRRAASGDISPAVARGKETGMPVTSRADAEALDRADPLARHRDDFLLPEGVLYLDGNSLGPLTRRARERVEQALRAEWGEGLIRSWNSAGWIDLPRTVAAKIAPLIGARPADVRVTDSTSVNLFKVLSAALGKSEGRRVILSEPGNFPTDLYIAEGVGAMHGAELVLAEDVVAALDEEVAVLMVTEVDYRTGRRHDMAAVTAAAHAVGALTIWDLAHSAGAFPVDLTGADADFAVGCGYKYLNGGPGAPAFVWVAPHHQQAVQPLSGWFGHAAPFAFEPAFRPAPGMDRFLTGTAPILSMTALDAALDSFAGVDLGAVRAKSVALADLMIERVDARCGAALTLASPREAKHRGSQVSFRHPNGYAIMQALIAAGAIGDFRAPDILRFGFTPLYLRFVDVYDAVEILAGLIEAGSWDSPEFHRRAAVT